LVSSEEAHRLVAEGSVLVDVRAPREFAAGHLPGAINFPVDEVKRRTEEHQPPAKNGDLC